MKKILILLLFFLIFPIGIKKLSASSDWTLNTTDGYYYYNKDIKFDGSTHYLESHNGNPILYDGMPDLFRPILYKVKLVAKLYTIGTPHAAVNVYNFNETTNNYDTVLNRIKLFGAIQSADWTEDTIVPLIFKYDSVVYNENNLGDLSLDGINYDLLRITKEEYDENYSILEWRNSIQIAITHKRSLIDIQDKNYVKYMMKKYYHACWQSIAPNDYDLETLHIEVLDTLNNQIYYKVIFGEIEDIAQTISSFGDLPKTKGTIDGGTKEIGSVFITKKDTTLYQLQINYDGIIYLISVNNIPDYIYLSKKVYYFSEGNNRYLIGFYENADGYFETLSFSRNLMENSWIVWNLGTGEFTRSEVNTIHVKLYSKGDGISSHNQLFADIVIPHNIDDLLSMSVYYQYRHKYLNGSLGQWQVINEQILISGRTGQYIMPWFIDLTRFYTWAINSNNVTSSILGIDEIQEVTPIDLSYKTNYINWLQENGSGTYNVNDIFTPGSKVYKLYLGTYNKFWSIGIQAKEFGILSYRYLYNGIEYSNPYPQFEAPPMPDFKPTVIDDFSAWLKKIGDGFWGFFVKASYIMIGVVGLLTAPIVTKSVTAILSKKASKHKTLIAIIWIGLLYVLWYGFVKW